MLYYFGLFVVLGLLFFNRVVAQIGLGPVYPFDVALVIALLINGSARAFAFSRPFLYGVGLIAGIWLIKDIQSASDGYPLILMLRRFAMAIYLLAPVLLMTYGVAIVTLVFKYPTLSAMLAVASQVFLREYGTAPITTAICFGSLFVAYLARYGALDKRSIPCLVASLWIGSGFGISDGVYRTPLLALGIGITIAVAYSAAIFRNTLTLFERKAAVFLVAACVAGLLLGSTLLQTSLGGVVNWRDYVDTPELVASGEQRERGDAGGTIATRILFWTSIIEYSTKDTITLLFGNGHSQSFFERIRPLNDFVDPDRLEPHNSFVGFYYRYGLVGLAFAMLYIRSIYKLNGACAGGLGGGRLACVAMALTYAFFEVALEVPQGAFTFWFALMCHHFVAEWGAANMKSSEVRPMLNDAS